MTVNSIQCDDQSSTAIAASESLRVVEVDFRKDSRWMDFISAHSDALIYHHPGWLSALEREYGRKCVALACEGQDSSFQAVLPLLPTRGLPFRTSRHQIGRRLSSLPRTPLAGPLADNSHAMKAILEHAITLAQAEQNVQLEIKSTIPGLDHLVPNLTCTQWRGTYRRGLPANTMDEGETRSQQTRTPRQCSSCDDCKRLRFGSARENHQVRWAAAKALKEGVSLRDARQSEELREWYQLYLRVMRRNVVPPRPIRFFQALWTELRPLGHLALVLAELDPHSESSSPTVHDLVGSSAQQRARTSDVISGSILLQFGQTVFWAFTGSNEACMKSHANDMTLWNCQHDSCKLGFNWFDMGEVAESNPNLVQFKAKWGTVLQPTYRYYYPPLSSTTVSQQIPVPGIMTRIARSAWQRLPLGVVALCGDWAFRFL